MPSQHTHDDRVLDRDHLRRMTLGDASLEREVLQLFVAQSRRIVDALAARPADAAALAHTLKGSARAIGAFGLADRAETLEAALKRGEAPADIIATLRDQVAAACADIARILENSH
jgi:HPt (histidine-containing phosphotransfer) domain-containing protein